METPPPLNPGWVVERCFPVGEARCVPVGWSLRCPSSLFSATGGGVPGGLREIEVKYRLGDLPALVRALADRGMVLSEPLRQDDQAYAERGWAYGQSKAGVTFARLRTQCVRHRFTVKRPLENEMACVEHETEVADRAAMHQAVLAMGFVPTVRIVKIRRTAARRRRC
jgi:adenylate cyclase class 2